MITRIKLICLVLSMQATANTLAGTINITDLGAKGDGKTDNTSIIQQGIDQCAKVKGTLIIPSGDFLTGPLFITSNVNIILQRGSTLLGSTDLETYHSIFAKTKGEKPPALIYGENVENISISGDGKIDGQGDHPNFQLGDDSQSGVIRPVILYFKNAKNIKVSDISLYNSAYWVQKYEACDGITIRGLKVYSHSNFNNDGLDINGSKNVIISDCFIDTDDDALCFKSEVETYAVCENIVVNNCILRSNCNGIKFGTGSMSGFQHVSISNCVVYKASEDNRRHWQKAHPWMGIASERSVISGIALECVDGGEMKQISVSNIMMRDVQTPIFIRLGDRKRIFSDKISTLKDINISHIIATSESWLSSSITGIPESQIENVSISNIQITSPGGVNEYDLKKEVPENINSYPENRMFGCTLPASGFYIRHVKGITFTDIRINTLQPDIRPAFYLKDTEEVEFSNCFINSRSAAIYECGFPEH